MTDSPQQRTSNSASARETGQQKVDCDTVVIGAGFAGLRAARLLEDAGKTVVLLEGSERVGGRGYSRQSAICPSIDVEVGGAYIHREHHPRVAAEIDRHGIDMQPSASATAFRNKLGATQVDSAWPVPVEEISQAEAGLFRALSDAHRIDLHAGLEFQGLDDLDIPLSSYIDSLDLPPVTRQLVKSWSWNMMGQPLMDATALWALQFIAAHHYSVFGVVLSIDEVFAGGTSTLAQAMANELRDIRYSSVVTAVHQRDEQVLVHVNDEVLNTREVIVATPLNTWRGVDFDPPLPSTRASVVDEGHGGRGLKLLVHVNNVPQGLSCTGDGVFPTLYEYREAPDGSTILVAFTDSSSFDPTNFGDVCKAVHYYVPEAEVIGVDYHDWEQDPLFQAPWVSPKVGQFTRAHKSLADPHGAIHFAGSDVSLQFPGYIEGAFETAERAVAEILAN
ncbi:flavin monoamine oxidase family protein [Rhodococcus qingshengii]